MGEALGLAGKIMAIHRSLDEAALPHAFGGALALAWCTGQARGTIDVDVNIFVAPARSAGALAGLPADVTITKHAVKMLTDDGQVRVWWGGTPIDVFLNTTEFHERVAERATLQPFMSSMVPFLACDDLAVFKAFFDRTKDWADLEAMVAAGTLDVATVLGALTLYLGGDDHRVARLRALVRPD